MYTRHLPRVRLPALLPAVPAPCLLFDSAKGHGFSLLLAFPQHIYTTLASVIDAAHRLPPVRSPLPFAGGLAGLLPYDLSFALHQLSAPQKDPYALPEVFFGHFTSGLLTTPTETIAFGASRAELTAVLALAASHPKSSPALCGTVTPQLTQQAYRSAFATIQHELRKGTTYQANLSQRFSAPFSGSPSTLYSRLRKLNPAPYACYLDTGTHQILSSSPELLWEKRGNAITTKPIAGTRKRGTTPAEDRLLAAELRTSPKEQAEHTMLVDLLRNDLGTVCRAGTVHVKTLAALERYRRVQHLVSTITGTLAQGSTFQDRVTALFPGGTITGCPKKETISILARLEGERRGAYTGSMGFLSQNGNELFNILIRTLTVHGDTVTLRSGGGIVLDSKPSSEYAETLAKARALFEALSA